MSRSITRSALATAAAVVAAAGLAATPAASAQEAPAWAVTSPGADLAYGSLSGALAASGVVEDVTHGTLPGSLGVGSLPPAVPVDGAGRILHAAFRAGLPVYAVDDRACWYTENPWASGCDLGYTRLRDEATLDTPLTKFIVLGPTPGETFWHEGNGPGGLPPSAFADVVKTDRNPAPCTQAPCPPSSPTWTYPGFEFRHSPVTSAAGYAVGVGIMTPSNRHP